ncbi:hypothetical protein KFE94_03435 [bacterium SCSIO 12643]|nr:hypothetical protein KFE94_03435 [bacterium SCSIO 12643]
MSKIGWIVLILSFCWVGGVNGESLSIEDHLYGVDNMDLPGDKMQLMNANLLDYQVEYDIFYAQKNYEKVAESLHKIALTYFQLDELDLAKNYAWRLKNVAYKYSFIKSELYANALLYKINSKQGNKRLAKGFLKEYQSILNTLPEVDWKKEVDNREEVELEVVETDIVPYESAPVVVKNVPKETNEQEAQLADLKYYLWAIVLLLLLMTSYMMIRNRMALQYDSFVEVSGSQTKVPVSYIEEKKVLDVSPDTNENENYPSSEPDGDEKKKDMIENEKNKEAEQESKRLSPELILSKRAGGLFEETHEVKTPLWVSGIEHHLKDLNTINGIRFEFNYSGNFNMIEENEQNIITRFLVSISETLVDANNVESVSAQLVSAKDGVVAMIISKPINVNMPILDVITIASIRKIYMSSNNFMMNTHNVPGGMLKFVLKKRVFKKALV